MAPSQPLPTARNHLVRGSSPTSSTTQSAIREDFLSEGGGPETGDHGCGDSVRMRLPRKGDRQIVDVGGMVADVWGVPAGVPLTALTHTISDPGRLHRASVKVVDPALAAAWRAFQTRGAHVRNGAGHKPSTPGRGHGLLPDRVGLRARSNAAVRVLNWCIFMKLMRR